MIEVINNDNLKKKDIDEYSTKARLLIENDNGKILVANYGGVYLLPGGTSEKDEHALETLFREIKEELGIDLNIRNIELLVEVEYYQKDYPKRDNKTVNRKLTTSYYNTMMNIDINKIKNNLTIEEIKDNFNLIWISKDSLISVLKENEKNSNNPRVRYFTNELVKVLNYYNRKEKTDYNSFAHKLASSGDDNILDLLKEERKRKEAYQKNSFIDMHMHSIYSDGEYTPDELIKMAYNNHLGTIAITDHDTLEGLKNISYYTDYARCMNIIPGIELSAKTNKGRMHILGYDFDIDDKDLNNKMNEFKTNSYYSILALINQLKIDYGIVFDNNDIKNIFNKTGNIGRPILAKLLIKYGYVKETQEAFDKYLIDAYQKTRITNKGIPYSECISLIKEAGGLAVLAHPNQLLMDDEALESTIKKMKEIGLDGIEVFHSGHTKEETKKYIDIATKYDLLQSGGSDYHGKIVKPNVKLGVTNVGKIKKLSMIDFINSYN